MSDRIAVMMGGEVLQCAPPDIIYEDPDDIRVAEFIGSPKINILPVENREGRASLLGRDTGVALDATAGSGLRMGLRPEALQLGGAHALLTGIVAHRENLGSEVYAHLDVAGLDQRLVLRASPKERARLNMGATVGVDFDPAAAMLFDAAGKRMRRAVLVPERETA